VVGTDKSVEALPGVAAAPELFHEDVAVLGTTLTGLSCLPERSVRRSGVIGSPLPPRRSTTTRCSAVRPAARSEDRPAAPAGLAALSGFGLGCPPRSCRTGSPLSGFRAPSATSAERSVSPGPTKARHRPSSGFLTPSTGCSPSGLADTLGPLPLMGFALVGPFRTERPRRVAASAAPFRPQCSAISNSEEYEVESSAALKALEPIRPGSTAVVPEPASPLRST
jgi:hypothetical protein